MFRMQFRMAVGRLLNDDGVDDALRAGGDEMQRDIMARCIDYDKDFKLKRLGLNANQRAAAALYTFSKEVKSAQYARWNRPPEATQLAKVPVHRLRKSMVT